MADEQEQMAQIRQALPGVLPLRRCGEGSYGAVFLARDPGDRLIAVKWIDKADIGSAWERERRGLENYCRAIPIHPHLVAILQISAPDAPFCYSMELADNANDRHSLVDYESDTLAYRLKHGGRMSLAQIIPLCRQMLDGLEALHDAELLHRDLKPGNIFFVNQVLKIGDIGLVSAATRERSLAGTLDYLPPQQRNGQFPDGTWLDFDADLYALGMTLYCMMTAHPAAHYPVLPPEVMADVSLRPLNEFLKRACSANPAERFASVPEFRAAFEEQVAAAAQERPGARPRRSLRRRLWWAVNGVFALLLLLCASFAWHFWRKSRGMAPPGEKGGPTANRAAWWSYIISGLEQPKMIFEDACEGDLRPGWLVGGTQEGGRRPELPATRDANGLREIELSPAMVRFEAPFEAYFETKGRIPSAELHCVLYSLDALGESSGIRVLVTPYGVFPPGGGGEQDGGEEPESAPESAMERWGFRLIGRDGRMRLLANTVPVGEVQLPPGKSWRLSLTFRSRFPGNFALSCLCLFQGNAKRSAVSALPSPTAK